MYLLEMPKKLRFVSRLEDLLQKKGWTYTDLHNKSGVSKTTIRSLTRVGDLERIDRSSTEKIISVLECSFDDLWDIQWEENDEQ